MRYSIFFILALWAPLSVFAQNTQSPQTLTPSPTVTLEAKVVQIVLNDEHRQGVDWEAIVADFHNLQLKKEDNPIWEDKKYRLSVGEISNEDFEVLLEALDTVGHVSAKDSPQIILNKDESKTVDISVDQKLLSTIYLGLKWFNSPAGEVKLKIEPAIGVILKDSSKPTSVQKLQSHTEVDLKDNTTVVIGGLMHEEEITKTHKFPLLGDLPLVGLVFRKQGKLMQKTETMVFLTIHMGSLPTTAEDQK